MDEPPVPNSPTDLRERLISLRETRRQRQANRRAEPNRRRPLDPSDREAVLRKTHNRCHICGGTVSTRWVADHVLAHARGGAGSVDNYLAAHALCNNYRWDYDSEEFQWILKIGVWARKKMEESTGLGDEMLSGFFNSERQRQARRSAKPGQGPAV
jgi:hypothetical protein